MPVALKGWKGSIKSKPLSFFYTHYIFESNIKKEIGLLSIALRERKRWCFQQKGRLGIFAIRITFPQPFVTAKKRNINIYICLYFT